MEIKFNKIDKLVEVKFDDDPNKIFNFSLDSEVKLTEFIKYISNMESAASIIPESFEAFQTDNEIQSKETVLLIEYLYKIVDSFNESYGTVFGTEK